MFHAPGVDYVSLINEKMLVERKSTDWGGKGLDVFIELAKRFDNQFQIVLVGTDETIDRQLKK